MIAEILLLDCDGEIMLLLEPQETIEIDINIADSKKTVFFMKISLPLKSTQPFYHKINPFSTNYHHLTANQKIKESPWEELTAKEEEKRKKVRYRAQVNPTRREL